VTEGSTAETSSGSPSRWRIAAGCLVLAGILFFAFRAGPIYISNLKLQNYVGEITRNVSNRAESDDILRGLILEKARILGLPVTADNVHINRSEEGLRVDVRYVVRLDLPAYTVNLHFYPGAGSR
jgi:hypothetical protein